MPLPKDPIKAEESRRKMSEAAKGRKRRPQSDETRRKISESEKGKIISEETRRKLSVINRGKIQSPETIAKRVEKLKGVKHPARSDESRQKYSESANLRWKDPEYRKRMSKVHTGKKQSPEIIEKRVAKITGQQRSPRTKKTCTYCGKELILTEWEKNRLFCSMECKGKWQADNNTGEKSFHWQGGISFEPYCQKFNNEFKERVRAFFNYQCIECGSPQNEYKLHIHHVNYNKKSCCDDSPPLFVPLCRGCHSRTNNKRDYWMQHFTDIINQYFSGKCYFTKEEMEKISKNRS